MATAAIDVPYLASYATVPESTINILLESPTVELVSSFLSSVTQKARDFDQLKAKNLRLDVELENVVRTAESKVKALKNTVEKGLTENASLRDSLQKEGMSHRQIPFPLLCNADLGQKRLAPTWNHSWSNSSRPYQTPLPSPPLSNLELLHSNRPTVTPWAC